MDAIERIVTRSVRAAGRIALEAGIASIEKLDMKATAQGGIAFAHQLGYKQALADAKAELHNLLSSMARNKTPSIEVY